MDFVLYWIDKGEFEFEKDITIPTSTISLQLQKKYGTTEEKQMKR